jgi:hypothetical protein
MLDRGASSATHDAGFARLAHAEDAGVGFLANHRRLARTPRPRSVRVVSLARRGVASPVARPACFGFARSSPCRETRS